MRALLLVLSAVVVISQAPPTPPGGSPAFSSVTSSAGVAVNTSTITWPATLAATDVLVMQLSVDAGIDITCSGWTEHSDISNGDQHATYSLIGPDPGDAGNTFDCTHTGGNERYAASIVRITDATGVTSGTGAAFSGTATPSAPTVTPASSPGIAVALCGMGQDGSLATWTAQPSGWNLGAFNNDGTTNGDVSTASAYLAFSDTSLISPGTWTISSAEAGACNTLAVY